MALMPDYLHMAPRPISHGTSACASSAFAPPTTNKIGAMGAIVPAYFSMTRLASRFFGQQLSGGGAIPPRIRQWLSYLFCAGAGWTLTNLRFTPVPVSIIVTLIRLSVTTHSKSKARLTAATNFTDNHS